jgi:hypothetical protein
MITIATTTTTTAAAITTTTTIITWSIYGLTSCALMMLSAWTQLLNLLLSTVFYYVPFH